MRVQVLQNVQKIMISSFRNWRFRIGLGLGKGGIAREISITSARYPIIFLPFYLIVKQNS